MSTELPPFVLLHGGRHGGWCWRRVARRLRDRGHDVFAPSFTGLGDRAHLLDPRIDLGTHVADVIGVFESHDLEDVVLVAHSYGGAVACRAMESVHPRVRSLVLLDAHMPQENESVFDIIGVENSARLRSLVEADGEGWYVPCTDAATSWGLSDPGDIAWVNAKASPQPVATYEDRSGSTAFARSHPYTFIECSGSLLTERELAWQKERCSASAQRRHRYLDAAHDAMVTDPDAVVTLLLEAVTPPAPMASVIGE